MSDLLKSQQHFMKEAWKPSPWNDRASLTPWADYAWFASVDACRVELPEDLSPYTFLIVQCGSGEDTHYYQFEGARNITITDIATRALDITKTRCPGVKPVIADTQHLPFADASFDYVGVRSGLHHLQDPFAGLAEMTRVARRACFFVENQRTPFVPLLVRLRLLDHIEEAGNEVYRFTRRETTEFLTAIGIEKVAIKTAWFMQIPPLLALSKRIPGRLPLALFRRFLAVFNGLFGRWGNAFCVVAHVSSPGTRNA